MAAVPEEQQWQVIIGILEKRPDLRERLRRTLFAPEFLSLPETVQLVEDQLRRLAEAQRRTQEQLDALMEMHRRDRAEWAEFRQATEERLTRLEATVQELIEAQKRSEERLDRLEATVQELIEAQKRSEERLDRLEATVQELVEAQKRTEVQMGYLIKAQERTEKTLNYVLEILKEHSKDIGSLKGEILEIRYRQHPTYFRALVHRPRSISLDRVYKLLDPALEQGVLTEDEMDEVGGADLVVKGKWRETGEEVYLTVEISWTIDLEDVERAAERAQLMYKAGLRAVPVVAGKGITPRANKALSEFKVWGLLDGGHVLPPERKKNRIPG